MTRTSNLTRTWTLCAAACALAAGCAGERPEPKEKAEAIPLKSIYVTFDQEGAKKVRRGGNEAPSADYRIIDQKLTCGASNIFLVRGKDIAAAGAAARQVLVGGDWADVPASTEEVPSKSYWLVAFLGIAGSDPPCWQVKPAEKRGKVIRLPVTKPKRDESTKDSHKYLVWVPLGELEAGTYTLELFDAAKKEPYLSRRISVQNK
jgi:hypothetical protein